MHDLFGLLWILLASHQSLSCINLSEQAFSGAERDDCHSIQQVSSAKKRGVLLMAFGKSLIYIRKSKGPGPYRKSKVHFLEVCAVLMSLLTISFERRHLQIIFNNISDLLLTDIHVTGHCPHGSFGIASDSGSDSINHFWRPRRLWFSTSKKIFSTLKFFKPANSVVNS